ncbi:MAG TPA: HRDC domain-containing protein [Pirellulaceae bacterium]|nr:HRDC domain-containing protein [Pirellulaceae bacterium]
MQYDHITTDEQLRDFCGIVAEADIVAFDTEFVSEDTYQPELCLIQVAVRGKLAIIDPFAVKDLLPFWELLTSGPRETLVHSGREEFRFCLRETGRRPTSWFDIQIAAGLVGLEYPASYGTLAYKLLNKTLAKGETRTDWRRRPLSQRQLEYALQDVHDLETIRWKLYEQLDKLGRLTWLEAELLDWQTEIEESERGERWRRIGGLAGMSRRSLAVVRELWTWRDAEAQRRDMPARRVLRDDLLLELAKRQTADMKRIRVVRGMEWGNVQKHLPAIGEQIEKAMALPDSKLPHLEKRVTRPQLNLLGQFLSTALGSICRTANVAASLAGTAQDVRDLIAYRLNLGSFDDGEVPILARGWRAEVVGQVIDHLLSGDLSIRITNPLADEPLAFEGRQNK